jgi:protein SCO1/2
MKLAKPLLWAARMKLSQACLCGLVLSLAWYAVGPPQSTAAPERRSIANPVLQTHEGKRVRFYGDLVKGKTVVINFMYSQCNGICPGITENLVKLQDAFGDRLGRDVFILSVSIDPKRDTPAALNEYAESLGTKPGWFFLTGQLDDITRLRRSLGLYDPDPVVDADRSQHSGVVVYGNDRLDRWAAMPGLTTPAFMASNILRLVQ